MLSSLPYFHVHLDRSSLQHGINERRQESCRTQIIRHGVMTYADAGRGIGVTPLRDEETGSIVDVSFRPEFPQHVYRTLDRAGFGCNQNVDLFDVRSPKNAGIRGGDCPVARETGLRGAPNCGRQ